MKKKNKVKLGLFKYDLFPYMVLHNIYDETKTDYKFIEGMNEWISKDRLICFCNIKDQEKIQNKLAETINSYSEQMKNVKGLCLFQIINFIEKAPLEKYILKLMKK